MSLLMKALANAEENKRILIEQAQQEDSEQQQAAANIFSASKNRNSPLSMLLNGLIGLIMLGIFWFSYQLYQLNQIPSNLTTNSLPAKPRPTVNKPGQVVLKRMEEGHTGSEFVQQSKPIHQTKHPQKITAKKNTKTNTGNKTTQEVSSKTVRKTVLTPANEEVSNKTDLTLVAQDLTPAAALTTTNEPSKTSLNAIPIKVERKAGSVVVVDNLQAAYEAYNAGDHTKAKTLYRSVLKQDIYQTDALLGMAAIAQKQGRFADASGWYQKVLAIEPNNPVALAGLAATRPQADVGSQEQRLKKLISKQPYHAQHYANLGNLYAAQNAWTKAQAAFFEANRHDQQNAQFAFNLAVSLEHLGKPTLAVQHYKRALSLVNAQQLSVPSRAQIQQRLEVLQ